MDMCENCREPGCVTCEYCGESCAEYMATDGAYVHYECRDNYEADIETENDLRRDYRASVL